MMDDATSTLSDAVVAIEPPLDPPPAIGTDERRMHVRAYNYWVSLLANRPYPAIADLDPASLADFGPHSVLLDFTGGDPQNPAIRYLGDALARECTTGAPISYVADVPPRSLLSRLTDHHLQIIANRAPIGFEAEFVGQRGYNTMYRGILMPFSSDGAGIDYIYGVINWKELADEDVTAAIRRQISQALASQRPAQPSEPLWADGPNAARSLVFVDDDADGEPEPELRHDDSFESYEFAEACGLADRLATAREMAAAAFSAHGRSRAALYRALGLAYDFALLAEDQPADYAELLADTGLKAQPRAPMTAVVKLVFGVDYDKTRLTEFAAALSHGRRQGLAAGALTGFIETHAGGLKGLVAAERRARRPQPKREFVERARDALRQAPVLSRIEVPSGEAEFVLLVARREEGNRLAVIAPVPEDGALIDRAFRTIAR